MQIRDKVFVVTGAASGLGQAVVKHLQGLGARLAAIDMDAERLEGIVESNATSVIRCEADVRSEEAVASALIRIQGALGRISGLINCAGIAPAAKVLGREGVIPLETFARVVEINLVGSFNVLRLVAQAMSETEPDTAGERGVIINTASTAAFEGQIGQAAYAASKAGIVGMTLPLARELARYGIRVMAIAPGIMATPMMAGMPQKVQDALGETVPFPPRMGDAKEFAALVAHIIENSYLNGTVIRLDGALRMAPK